MGGRTMMGHATCNAWAPGSSNAQPPASSAETLPPPSTCLPLLCAGKHSCESPCDVCE